MRTFCQPSYEWVIAESVAAGLLDAPGFFEDPLVRLRLVGRRVDRTGRGDAPAPDRQVAGAAGPTCTNGDWQSSH